MDIYTSYYAKAQNFNPKEYTFLQISNSVPSWWRLPITKIQELVPDWGIVDGYKKGVYTDSWIDRYDKEYWERDRKKHRHFEKLTGRDVDKLTEKDMIIEYLKLLETNASEQEIGDFNAFEKLFGVKKKEKHKTPEKKNKFIKQPKPESVKEVREEPVKQEKQADAFPEERAVETNGGNDADLFNGIWESYPMGLELFRTIKDKDVLDYMDDEKKGA